MNDTTGTAIKHEEMSRDSPECSHIHISTLINTKGVAATTRLAGVAGARHVAACRFSVGIILVAAPALRDV